LSKAARTPLIEDRQVGADLVGMLLLESKVNLKAPFAGHLPGSLAALEKQLRAVELLDISLPESGAETFRSVIRQAPNISFVVLSGAGVDGERRPKFISLLASIVS
jgi:hypothetical protein